MTLFSLYIYINFVFADLICDFNHFTLSFNLFKAGTIVALQILNSKTINQCLT